LATVSSGTRALVAAFAVIAVAFTATTLAAAVAPIASAVALDTFVS
jgi:hypothetical protein